jgi:hypothetical protein
VNIKKCIKLYIKWCLTVGCICSANVRTPVLILYFYVRIFVQPDRLILQEGWLYRLYPILLVFCVVSMHLQFPRFYFVWRVGFYVRHVFSLVLMLLSTALLCLRSTVPNYLIVLFHLLVWNWKCLVTLLCLNSFVDFLHQVTHYHCTVPAAVCAWF